MSLKPGYSRATIQANIRELQGRRHPTTRELLTQKQIVAIALEEARKSYFKRYPHGALPTWLTPPDGRRLKNPCACRPGLPHKIAEKIAVQVASIRIHHGHAAANRAYTDAVMKYNLTDRDEARIVAAYRELLKGRAPNPVPESSRSQKRSREARIQAAANLYENFTGHAADEYVSIDKPVMPDVMLAVGDVDGILYTTVRDGNVEKYIHKFKKDSRPLFCVSHDGKQLHMLGGAYDFTERGIVDRSTT